MKRLLKLPQKGLRDYKFSHAKAWLARRVGKCAGRLLADRLWWGRLRVRDHRAGNFYFLLGTGRRATAGRSTDTDGCSYADGCSCAGTSSGAGDSARQHGIQGQHDNAGNRSKFQHRPAKEWRPRGCMDFQYRTVPRRRRTTERAGRVHAALRRRWQSARPGNLHCAGRGVCE